MNKNTHDAIISAMGTLAVLGLLFGGFYFETHWTQSPSASPTPPPYNAFAQNCSELETLVNENMTWSIGTRGYNDGGAGGASRAITDLQIMQLKGCKP